MKYNHKKKIISLARKRDKLFAEKEILRMFAYLAEIMQRQRK